MLRTSGVAAEAEAIYYNMAKFEMAKKSFANVHIEAGPQFTHTTYVIYAILIPSNINGI